MRPWGSCIVTGLLVIGVARSEAGAQDTIPPADTTAARELPELVVQADRLAVGGIPLDRFPMAAEVRSHGQSSASADGSLPI